MSSLPAFCISKVLELLLSYLLALTEISYLPPSSWEELKM